MQATGRLFLQRTRPCAKRAADGTFGLQLYAVDRIGTHQTEAWVVLWYGPDAEAFWLEHQAALIPGAGIELETQRIRAHQVRGCVPEIHATASRVALLPGQRINPSHQPDHATA
jgi:hypothetical protein